MPGTGSVHNHRQNAFINMYWLDDAEAPYATFLSIIQTFQHTEVDDLGALQEFAQLTDESKPARFKHEFREVMADPTVLPTGALFTAAEYDDRSDEAFLAHLWRELYGDESPTDGCLPE